MPPWAIAPDKTSHLSRQMAPNASCSPLIKCNKVRQVYSILPGAITDQTVERTFSLRPMQLLTSLMKTCLRQLGLSLSFLSLSRTPSCWWTITQVQPSTWPKLVSYQHHSGSFKMLPIMALLNARFARRNSRGNRWSVRCHATLSIYSTRSASDHGSKNRMHVHCASRQSRLVRDDCQICLMKIKVDTRTNETEIKVKMDDKKFYLISAS